MDKCHRQECDPQLIQQPLMVQCQHCGFAGFVARSEEEAIELWNKNVAPLFVGRVKNGYWASKHATHDDYPER